MRNHQLASLALCVLVIPFAVTTYGSLWTSYGPPLGSNLQDPYLAPPGHGNPNDGQDIITVSYATSATHHYFRIDLEGAPSAVDGIGDLNYSGMYGLYIDADNNAGTGGAGVAWDYIPNAVSGIEIILDSHYDPFFGGYFQWDKHTYSGGTFGTAALVASEHEENGATLEWAVAKADLQGEFKFWVAAHDQGSSVPTYDLEGSWVVPEPATLGLLGVFSSGIWFVRRFFPKA